MVIYPDTSALVALFKPEVHTLRSTTVLNDKQVSVCVSDFCMAEVGAALAALFRLQQMDRKTARARFRQVDQFVADLGPMIGIDPADLAVAADLVRQLDVRLRVPDAIHLAICRRIGATLLTFDDDQAAAAKVFDIVLCA